MLKRMRSNSMSLILKNPDLFKGGRTVSWWLSGGILAGNCIIAYQPKGAANLAASYSNLANPGTYDAAPGTAPSFNTATGWTFDGATTWLTTGYKLTSTNATLIVRVANINNADSLMCTFGQTAGGYYLTGIRFIGSVGHYDYSWGGAGLSIVGTPTSGVFAMAGLTAYKDGIAEAGSIGDTALGDHNLDIGTLITTNQVLNGDIIALAVYNTTLDATTIGSLTAAMAAL